MQLTACEITGYRSLRAVRLPLGSTTILVGENGAGKTNLLRALELIQGSATGAICRMLADEGGMDRVLWAGRSTPADDAAPTSIRLTAHLTNLRYSIEIAGPGPGDAALAGEATVREEILAHTGIEGDGAGERTVMHRQGTDIRLRDAKGQRQHFKQHLQPSETALHALRDSASYPELAYVRQLLEGWRIYHRFNIATDAPSRAPARAVITPALAVDGGDLAAALASIFSIKQDRDAFNSALSDAFPGATLDSSVADGQARFQLKLPDFERELYAREISEGTLQYICLLAALAAYRKPALIAINEPEASLHESFLGPLARMIARTGNDSQICIVTQSSALAREIAQAASIKPMTIRRLDGRTVVDGAEEVLRTPNTAKTPPIAMGAPPTGPESEASVVIVKKDQIPTESVRGPEPELDAQIEEVRSLTSARNVLGEIRKLIGQLREHPDQLAEIHPKIEARLAKLRTTAVALPPEFSALTSRLDEELRSIAAAPKSETSAKEPGLA